MGLDLEQMLDQMADAMKDAVGEDAPGLKNDLRAVLERRRDRLQMVVDVVEDQLSQQQKVLENELLELKVKSKVVAEKAAGAAMDVLLNAVKSAIEK